MNEKQEHRKRYNKKLEYIAHFQSWANSEPSMFRIIAWCMWLKRRPTF